MKVVVATGNVEFARPTSFEIELESLIQMPPCAVDYLLLDYLESSFHATESVDIRMQVDLTAIFCA